MRTTWRVAALSVIAVTVSVCTLAQPVTPTPQMKPWDRLVGKWVNQEELRLKPDGPWQKASSYWEIRWLNGGFFLETPGGMTMPDGQRLSWVQVYGYDPARKVQFTSYYQNNGVLGTGTWEWSGTTTKEDGVEVAPDGAKNTYRCVFVMSADYRTSEGTCEWFTNGNWWVFRKVKGTKQ